MFALSNALFVRAVKPNQSVSTNQLGGSTETDLRPQSLAGIWDFGASLSFDAEANGTLGTTGQVKVTQTMGTQACSPWLTALMLVFYLTNLLRVEETKKNRRHSSQPQETSGENGA